MNLIPEWVLIGIILIDTFAVLVLSLWAVGVQSALNTHMETMAQAIDNLADATARQLDLMRSAVTRVTMPGRGPTEQGKKSG